MLGRTREADTGALQELVGEAGGGRRGGGERGRGVGVAGRGSVCGDRLWRKGVGKWSGQGKEGSGRGEVGMRGEAG